jgi:FtsH-binding integral membrane protein
MSAKKPKLTLRNLLKNVGVGNWAWVNVKLGLFLFGLSILIFTPQGARDTLQWATIWLWAFSCIVGAAVSVTGLIMSKQPYDHPRKYGVFLELAGLIMLLLGPAVYWIIQTYIVLSHGDMWEQRVALMWFTYAFTGVIIARIVTVVPHFRAELADMKDRPKRGRGDGS